MPTRRGTSNRKTGKTTPRTKGKTHWGRKSSARRSPTSKKSPKAAATAKK